MGWTGCFKRSKMNGSYLICQCKRLWTVLIYGTHLFRYEWPTSLEQNRQLLWPFNVLFFGPSTLDLLILSFKFFISALYFASLPNPDVHRTDVLLDHNLPKNFYEKGSNAKRNHAIMRVLWLPPEKILVIIARFQIWNLNFFWMKNPNWLVNNNWVRMKSVGQVKVLLLFFDCNISFWLLWNQFNTYRN